MLFCYIYINDVFFVNLQIEAPNDMRMKTKTAYVAPLCDMESQWLPCILCTSPAAGENESVEYDDWKDLIS